MSLPVAWEASFCLTRTARAHVMVIPRSTRTIHIGAISYCFTNISTAKPAAAVAQVTKPDGLRWP